MPWHGDMTGCSMRTFTRFLLLSALLLSLVGLTAVPASATTKRSLTAKLSTSAVPVGAKISISGKLSKSPKKSAVTIQRRSGSKWVKVASTKTNSKKGTYKASFKAPTTGGVYSYRAQAAKKGKLKVATSKIVSVDVRRKVTITSTLTPATIGVGSTVELKGGVSPGVAGTKVTIQRIAGSAVTTITTTTVRAGGVYSATIQPPSAGSFTYRASMPARTGYATATSPGRSVTVSPTPTAPVITTTTLPTATLNMTYIATVQTAGNQPGTWAVSPALPAGLTLNPSNGTISGFPSAPSSLPHTFTFTHTNGLAASKALTLSVYAMPSITTGSLPVTSPGATYDEQLTASEPGTWTVTGGKPSWLTVSPGGHLTGTPTTITTEVLSLRFTSTASGLQANTDLPLDIRKNIATDAVPVASSGTPYSFNLRTNGTIAGAWSYLGGLPAGLNLDPDGTLSGTVTSTTVITAKFTPTNPSYAASTVNLFLELESPMPSNPSTNSLSGGSQFACRVLAADQSLSCWGYGFAGQLGLGDLLLTDQYKPTPQLVGTGWRSVSAGEFHHACAIKTTNTLWCWGYNNDGQLGSGDTIWWNAPHQVQTGTSWASVSTGVFHTCGIKTDGTMWCWGTAALLGASVAGSGSSVPVQVGSATWKSVAANNGTTCAIKSDDSLWCWGRDIGLLPQQLGSATWASIDAGSGTLCGIQTDGSLWCWGNNSGGQLGNGTTTASAVPVQVGSDTTWHNVSTSVASGASFSCGTKTNGTAWCWGNNADGQLGNGSGSNSLVPVRVDTTSTWSSVAAGDRFACGAKNDGSQRCWGSGGSGELGNGQRNSSPLPVHVS